MLKPTVYILHKDMNFLQTVEQRLNGYGIPVVGSVYVDDLQMLFSEELNHIECLILQIDLDTYQWLNLNNFFDENSPLSHLPVIALVNNDSLFNHLAKLNLPNLKLYHYHVLIDRLVLDVLNRVPILDREQPGIDHIVTLYGSLAVTPLYQVLEFATQMAFTGKIIVQSENEYAVIQYLRGQLTQVSFGEEDGYAALKKLYHLKNAIFHFEQKLFKEEDLQQFIHTSNIQTIVATKDILIDVFYFMISYFEGEIDNEHLHEVVIRNVDEINKRIMPTVHLVYLPNLQEKLRIVGQLETRLVGYIMDGFEEIYDELASPASYPGFKVFLNSLDELSPYLAQLNAQLPVIRNGSARAVTE